MAFWRRNRGQEPSQSQPESEQSEPSEETQGEVPLSASSDRPSIADKVRFWEEQDRINQELIPRVLKQHELLTAHVASHEESKTQMVALDSRIDNLSESYKRDTAALDSRVDYLNESHKRDRAELEERVGAEMRAAKRLALSVSLASLGVACLAIILALVM